MSYVSKDFFDGFPKKYNWGTDGYSRLWGQSPFNELKTENKTRTKKKGNGHPQNNGRLGKCNYKNDADRFYEMGAYCKFYLMADCMVLNEQLAK